MMKINLAKSAGFCFGVKRAIDIAFKTAASGTEVYMLGDIVHNEDVIKQVQKAGIKKIVKLGKGKDKILLIRAHGTGTDVIAKAKKLGYIIVDATCPMVKEIHQIAKDAENKGYKVIIIGDRKHDEVHGISGQLKQKALVIEKLEDIPIKRIKKAAVVVQSTQDIEKVLKIVESLKPNAGKLQFYNTICRPTILKQNEIKKMPLENELMIIIGSKTSANTRRLYEISKSLNRKSFWVQSKKDLKAKWFKGIYAVGISAGASTPDSTIKEIIKTIPTLIQNPCCRRSG